MKRIINLFRQHRPSIEMFLRNVIEEGHLAQGESGNIDTLFHRLPSLQVLYLVDSDYRQNSPNFYRKGIDDSQMGMDKSHYFHNIRLEEGGSYLSNPYLHHLTGHASVTLVQRLDTGYAVMDFDLLKLLEALKLIEHNSRFERMNVLVYGTGGFALALIAVFLIIYGSMIFVHVFITPPSSVLHDIFKGIIAVTLGLAIYDLSKTILENEVMYKNAGREREDQYGVLGKFLISIIIALSIESLMVVFKISLGDYTGLGYAFLLIMGVTMMIVGVGWFHSLTKPTFIAERRSKERASNPSASVPDREDDSKDIEGYSLPQE